MQIERYVECITIAKSIFHNCSLENYSPLTFRPQNPAKDLIREGEQSASQPLKIAEISVAPVAAMAVLARPGPCSNAAR